jgi:hypothetical protein
MTLDLFRKELDKMLSGAVPATKHDFAANAAALAGELEAGSCGGAAEVNRLIAAFREIEREMRLRQRRPDGGVKTLAAHLREPYAAASGDRVEG